MYKKIVVISLLSLIVIASISLVSAFSFSSWLKNLLTGDVVEGENETPVGEQGAGDVLAADTGASCGTYELETPKSAVASSQFNNYRPANAIDENVETHWFGPCS